VVSIAVAMVVSWQAHRRLTFRVASPPTLAEFSRFVASSLVATCANYVMYAAILLWQPGTHPVAALFLASLVGMVVSYAGLRLGVFGRPNHD
jgi:putative flippase GtrA